LDDMESLPFPPFPDFIDLLPFPEERIRRSATWIELSAVIGVVVMARTAMQAARQRAKLLLNIIVCV